MTFKFSKHKKKYHIRTLDDYVVCLCMYQSTRLHGNDSKGGLYGDVSLDKSLHRCQKCHCFTTGLGVVYNLNKYIYMYLSVYMCGGGLHKYVCVCYMCVYIYTCMYIHKYI